MTMEEFVAQGGFEGSLNGMINELATEEFAKRSGMLVSKALIDGEIASNPVFQGVDGKFDQKTFDALLSRERVAPQALRDDIMRGRYSSWLLIPGGVSAGEFPKGVLAPYASLLLERRQGIGTLIRSIDMDPGADPDDATLTAYYKSHLARYTVPQRRMLRYAIVHPDQFKAQSTATDAEIAAAFAKSGPRYAATEKRTVHQIVLLDQATANSVAAQIKAGKPIADVAKGMGLEASDFEAIEKPALARQTAPAVRRRRLRRRRRIGRRAGPFVARLARAARRQGREDRRQDARSGARRARRRDHPAQDRHKRWSRCARRSTTASARDRPSTI
ncbi:MAG: SurA N-terminal domain-containing protein [Sphingomonas sp.]